MSWDFVLTLAIGVRIMEIINQYFEQLIWTNYGGALFTILGRDIGFFILGYLFHIIIETLIEITKGE